MNLRRFDVALIITGVALAIPLMWSWASYMAPFLALLGVVLTASVVIYRTSQSLALGEPQKAVVVSSSFNTGVPRMNAQSHVRIGAAALPPPQSGLLTWVQDKWGEMWNSKKHGLMVLCAIIYILSPVDIWPEFLLGFVDDGFAAVLGVKHFVDCFKRDVTGVHASLQGAIARAQQRDAIEAEVIDVEAVERV